MWLPQHLKDTPDMDEFLSQIRGATHENFTRADDGPDLVTMAMVSMHVVYPSDNEVLPVGYRTSGDNYIWQRYEVEDESDVGSTVF
jgi:hypothetical protein